MAYSNDALQLRRLDDGRFIRNYAGQEGKVSINVTCCVNAEISCCAVSPDGLMVLAGSFLGTLTLWGISINCLLHIVIAYSRRSG